MMNENESKAMDSGNSPVYEFGVEVKRIPQGWAVFYAGKVESVYDDPERAHEAAKEVEEAIRDE